MEGAGTLGIGTRPDIAILEVAPGSADLFDIYGNVRPFDRGFVCHATVVGGREMAPKPVPEPPPWIRLIDREASIVTRAQCGRPLRTLCRGSASWGG